MGTLSDADLRHLLGEAAGSYAVPDDGRGEVRAASAGAPVHRLQSRRFVRLVAAAAAVAVVGVVAVNAVRDTGPAQVTAASGPESADRDTSGGDVVADLSAGGGGTTGSTAAGEVAAPAPVDEQLALTAGGSVGAAAPGAAAPVAAAPVAADGARVVKTGAIALLVEDGRVSPTLTAVQELGRAAGGVVATGTTQESGPTPSGSVVLRVPVGRFEQVVAGVRGLDAEVRSATTSGQDVTAQYADLEAQLRTLTAARERFLAILSRADSIGDVLAVQQRVDDVTGRIDRLEGQRRVLADQSDKATLEVVVTEEDDPAVRTEQTDDGLGKAFADAWEGFTSGVEGLIRLSGRGVLLLLCLAVAAVVLRVGWRLSRRRLV